MTTAPGENRSIYFTAERLSKLERIAEVHEKRTGIRPRLSAVVGLAIDTLFLAVCPPDKTINDDEGQSTEAA